MTRERAIQEATKLAKRNNMTMVAVNDPIANNLEDEPDGPWGYCPDIARGENGKLMLFPWAEEVITISP
jgi:hypothetical protein